MVPAWYPRKHGAKDMNYAQRPVDDLAMLSWMPAFDTGQNLGQYAEAAMAIYGAMQEDDGIECGHP